MKLATVIHEVPGSGLSLDKVFEAWVTCALKVFEPSDIVLMIEENSKYKGLWPNIVILEPLDYKPVNRGMYAVLSDWYKVQGYHLIQGPVMVLDLDCFIVDKIEEWEDDIYRIGQHNLGTAPESDLVKGELVPHVNCAVQYQGRDYLLDYKKCLAQVMEDENHSNNFMLGEIAYGLMCQNIETELLSTAYSWFTLIEPFPQDVKILHYGCSMKDVIYKELDCVPVFPKKPPKESRPR